MLKNINLVAVALMRAQMMGTLIKFHLLVPINTNKRTWSKDLASNSN